MKVPVPEPSVVWLSAMVGLAEVLQQTPRAVTGESPWSVTLPPPVAVVPEIFETGSVVTVGPRGVVKEASVAKAPPASAASTAWTL